MANDRGLTETIEAMQTLSSKYPSIALFFLGSGPFEQELKRIIETHNIANVFFHGPVEYSRVPEFIAMSDVGVVPLPDLPKWRSQCPLKLLEYLAMAKPVIITDIPAHRSIVKNEPFGIFAGSSDQQEIAKAIIFAYENRERLFDWGQKGKSIASKEYTWDKVAKKLQDYLLDLKQNTASKTTRYFD